MITIDRNKAIELMEQAIAEKGADHRVDTCSYTRDGVKGNCIVGKAFELAGADLSKIFTQYQTLSDGYDDRQYSREIYVSTSRVKTVDWSEFNIEVDGEAIELFDTAQYHQDSGNSWGRALELAQ